jgi:uncharacterized protein YrrD
LRTSQEVIGLAVYHQETGKKLGTVCDLLFDDSNKLRGLLLENGGWLKRRRFLPAEAILSIGKDAVVMKKGKTLQPLDSSLQQCYGLVTGDKALRGRSLLLTSGLQLGTVENVYFQEELGTLIGYELSEGWLNDLRFGRKMLKAKEPLIWGEDTLLANSGQIQLEEIG